MMAASGIDRVFKMAANDSAQQFSVKLVRTPGTGSSWGFKLMGGAGYRVDQATQIPLLIQSVVANSIASRNGLQPGDAIIAIDGRPSANSTLEQAKMMLIRAGNEVSLVVKRDESLKKFTESTAAKKVATSTAQMPLSVGGGSAAAASGGGSRSRKPISVSEAFPRRMAPSPPLPDLPQTSWKGTVPEEIAPIDHSLISNVGIVPFERSPAFNKLASGRVLPPQMKQTATNAPDQRISSEVQINNPQQYEQHQQPQQYEQYQQPTNYQAVGAMPPLQDAPISSEGQISRSFRALETDLAHSAATGERPASIFDLKRQQQQQQQRR